MLLRFFKQRHYIQLIVFGILVQFIDAVDIGSDTAVTRFNNQVTINNGDRVAGFAALNGGFSINGSNATGTFDSFFQVSGPLAFNAGTLILNQDLCLSNVSNVGPLGDIVGNFHAFDLSETVTVIPDRKSVV
mgnify:CR=1 FL=1